MSNGKTPGSDGLPKEFFITFWDILKDDFVEMANYCFTVGVMPVTLQRAIITLLYKKDHLVGNLIRDVQEAQINNRSFNLLHDDPFPTESKLATQEFLLGFGLSKRHAVAGPGICCRDLMVSNEVFCSRASITSRTVMSRKACICNTIVFGRGK